MQSISEDTQDLFDQRLRGELSETALSEFNQRLLQEPSFAEAWAEFQLLTEGLKRHFSTPNASETEDLRKRIAQTATVLEAEGFFRPGGAKQQRKSFLKWRWLIVSLAFFALIGLIFTSRRYFKKTPPPAPELIYASAFKIEQNQLSATLDEMEKYGLEEADAERRQALATALELVEEQRFVEAIPLLKDWLSQPALPTTSTDRTTAAYFLAQALMASGETGKEPLQLLAFVTSDPAFPSVNDARWFMALCHIKNQSLNEARPLLKIVADGHSEHAQEAANILQQIN